MPIPEQITGNMMEIMHIIFGFIIMYVGYRELNHYGISQLTSLLLIITGSVAVLYSSFLIYKKVAE